QHQRRPCRHYGKAMHPQRTHSILLIRSLSLALLPPAGGRGQEAPAPTPSRQGWVGGKHGRACPSPSATLGFPPPRLPPLGGGKPPESRTNALPVLEWLRDAGSAAASPPPPRANCIHTGHDRPPAG